MTQTKLYRKKPIPVKAYQYTMDMFLAQADVPGVAYTITGTPFIQTLEGRMTVAVGSYVVQGPHGEYWAVKEHIFNDTYEEVTL
jgi:hypothetical protein